MMSSDGEILEQVLDALNRVEGAVAMQSEVMGAQADALRAQTVAFKEMGSNMELLRQAVLQLRGRVSHIEDEHLSDDALASWAHAPEVIDNDNDNGNGSGRK